MAKETRAERINGKKVNKLTRTVRMKARKAKREAKAGE